MCLYLEDNFPHPLSPAAPFLTKLTGLKHGQCKDQFQGQVTQAAHTTFLYFWLTYEILTYYSLTFRGYHESFKSNLVNGQPQKGKDWRCSIFIQAMTPALRYILLQLGLCKEVTEDTYLCYFWYILMLLLNKSFGIIITTCSWNTNRIPGQQLQMPTKAIAAAWFMKMNHFLRCISQVAALISFTKILIKVIL